MGSPTRSSTTGIKCGWKAPGARRSRRASAWCFRRGASRDTAATIASTGSITVEVALAAILVAFLVNMAVKLGIVAFAGGPRLLFLTAPPLGAMAFAAIAAYAAIR